MESGFQEFVAFHLTGRRHGVELQPVGEAGLRPALFAGYRDLTQLRYDYPLVLLRNAPADRSCIQALSGIVDGVINEIARGDDGDRLTRHVLRLELRIRAAVAAGASGVLTALWDRAAGEMAAEGDDLLKDSLKRARTALKIDGEVLDCGRETPAAVMKHLWARAQEAKSRRMRESIGGLTQKLSDILRVDFAHSKAGLTADNLQAAVGTAFVDAFDFGAMSRILSKSSGESTLPPGRHRRIEELLGVLKSQRFFHDPNTNGIEPYQFAFDDCSSAVAAYRERLPKAIELAKAIAIAELEVDGQYNEARHDELFDDFGADGLETEDLARFPDYLVCIGDARLHGAEYEMLTDIFSAGLPMKVMVQTDDILEEPSIGGDAHLSFGLRSKQLANMAIGLNDVYVLQSSVSHLFQFRDRVLKGLAYAGPALFSVYSGAGGQTDDFPAYLNAAAGMESRAFPAFCYDPAAGGNWAARFHLAANPQVEADWPVQQFAYEDEIFQRVETEIAFTLIDFVACDKRYAKHFALVPKSRWSETLVPVSEFLKLSFKGTPDKLPCILMVDGDNNLRRAIVDDRLIRAAMRCREAWHSLQELAGIHNSHAERLLARERKAWEEQHEAAPIPQEVPAATAAPVAPAAEPEAATSPDEAYIETPRCTSCNECTKINNKMFVYNENKQAYIADINAGTFAQLVLAAESCPVAIIHPGKPRNPNEPGIEDLLARAEPFR